MELAPFLFVLFIMFRAYRAVIANRQARPNGMSDLSGGEDDTQLRGSPSTAVGNQMSPMRQSAPQPSRSIRRPKTERRGKDDPFRGMNEPTTGSALTIDDIIT